MRSGRNNALVTIYSQTKTTDPDSGNPIYTPAVWKADVFCNAIPRRGREVAIDGQVETETYMKFDFEYFEVEGITETMYIVCEGITYDIKAILRDVALKEWTSVDAVART